MRYRLLIVAAALLAAGCGSAPSAPGAGTSGSHTTSPTTTAPIASSSATPSPGSHADPACSGQPAGQSLVGDSGPDALTAVQFVSASQGWVVGRREILATTDGGTTWNVQDRGGLNLMSVDFISATTGWALGARTLLFTDDGGQHWSALPEPCPPLDSVHFVSASTGFAIAGGSGLQGTSTTAPGTGGVVLTTGDGGRTWQSMPAPANAQSVCFSDQQSGWLGANGDLYSSDDGGRHWTLRARGPSGSGIGPGFMTVQCAQGSAWAEDIGPGAAMSQEPHVGFHADQSGVTPIFAEQYFPHPGVAVKVESPSAYAGPMSAISSSSAAFVDWCDACGYGTAPWDLATANGTQLLHEGNVTGINQPFAASFLSASAGWVVGTVVNGTHPIQRIVRTENGGQSWQVQYSAS
jgi:photosystem II stability/assembly factor-like uncharacterized protein